jgi:hypothetical protein
MMQGPMNVKNVSRFKYVDVTRTVHVNYTAYEIKTLYNVKFHIFIAFLFGFCTVKKKKKGKAVPLEVWSGPEGSRNLR